MDLRLTKEEHSKDDTEPHTAKQHGATDVVEVDAATYRRHRKLLRGLRVGADTRNLFGEDIPAALLTDYPVDDINKGLKRNIQKKYAKRAGNIRRCWNRTELLLPELMHDDAPKQRVLEMSTAHGAMLEVLRHFGHDVTGNDFANMVAEKENGARAIMRDLNDENFVRKEDDYGLKVVHDQTANAMWPYKTIIESIGIPMKIFDAGKTPYPLDDKAYDVLICTQAIDHYCHPKDWMAVIEEFCRVTSKTIVILLNPVLGGNWGKTKEYDEAFDAARRALRKYRRNGFTCTATHMFWGEALGFKLTAS